MLSYVAELELLIKETLLPVFDRYYREKGQVPKYTNINPELLKLVLKEKKVPALFKPANKQ